MKFQFLEEPWLYRRMQSSLDNGRAIQLIWPSNITAEEVEHMEEVIALQIKSLKRFAAQEPVSVMTGQVASPELTPVAAPYMKDGPDGR